MSSRYLRPGVLVGHLLVLAAALTCLRLGWWQWDVAREARGTVQNLGYALLWPVFAGSFIYMWLRFLHLESERDVEQAAGPDPLDAGPAPAVVPPAGTDGATRGARRRAVANGMVPDGAVADGAVPDVAAPVGSVSDGLRAPSPPGSEPADPGADAGIGGESEGAPEPDRERRSRWRVPTETYTVAVATVGGDDDDDPELAAYNQALAALAEQDRRRAR